MGGLASPGDEAPRCCGGGPGVNRNSASKLIPRIETPPNATARRSIIGSCGRAWGRGALLGGRHRDRGGQIGHAGRPSIRREPTRALTIARIDDGDAERRRTIRCVQNLTLTMAALLAGTAAVLAAVFVLDRRGRVTPLQILLGLMIGVVGAFIVLVSRVDLVPDGPEDGLQR